MTDEYQWGRLVPNGEKPYAYFVKGAVNVYDTFKFVRELSKFRILFKVGQVIRKTNTDSFVECKNIACIFFIEIWQAFVIYFIP